MLGFAVNSKRSTSTHRPLLIDGCFVLVICLLLFYVGSAGAHAELVAAEPATGVTLTESPAEIHLTFSENLGADSQVVLIGDNFARIAGVVVREIVFNEVFVTVPPLEAGVYTVQYDVVSADNHPISGSYEFAVQPPSERGRLLSGTIFGMIIAFGMIAWQIYRRWQKSLTAA
jgi:methionine-rich copper-binding protein CopC